MNVNANTARKQYEAWISTYEPNNNRGKDCIAFATGDQWTNDVINMRMIDNKETLVFNLCLKHLRRMKAQSKQIEFSLNLSPTNQEYATTYIEQTNAFRILLGGILLSDEALKVFSDGLDKCLEFGYAFAEVNFDRENEETLCNIPCVRLHQNPAIAFWDKNAVTPTKTDGRFCGIRRLLTKEEVAAKYPEYKDKSWLKENNNEMIDYWFRDYIPALYFKMKGGKYKREDLITEDDQELVELNPLTLQPITQKANVCKIFFKRFCNDYVVQKKTLFPTDDLPLPYHFALTTWMNDDENNQRTFPFIYPLMGPQKLHNYTQSQLAVSVKNATGAKWLGTPDNVQTKSSIENAKNINRKSGFFTFDKDPEGKEIQYYPPTELPATLINLSQATEQSIDNIAGALINNQQTDQSVLSGSALNTISHNIELLQAQIMASHIEWVNEIGRLQRQMIPKIITEERTLVVKAVDGAAQAITVNQLLDTGKIKNNVKDIDNNFHYEIKAGPSSTMQKLNTQRALLSAYQISPPLLETTSDIFARTLDTEENEEIARRWGAMIDPMLIKYSKGEISLQQLQQYKQQQQQQQQQAMMQHPQFQAMVQAAQAEQTKGQAAMFEAQTNREEALAKDRNEQKKILVQLIKIMSEQDLSKQQLMLQAIQRQLDEDRLNNEENENAIPSD